jgi:hypothetical protein
VTLWRSLANPKTITKQGVGEKMSKAASEVGASEGAGSFPYHARRIHGGQFAAAAVAFA